jgi:hypothetical protein
MLGAMIPSCPSCESPHVLRRRVYRRGSLAVSLGHFLLVPAVLMTVLASMGVVGRRVDPLNSTLDVERASTALEASGIPAPVAEAVVARRPLSGMELDALSPEQRQTVREAQMSAADDSARLAMGRTTSTRTYQLAATAALVSGILGVFLVRKKTVALCSSCGAAA